MVKEWIRRRIRRVFGPVLREILAESVLQYHRLPIGYGHAGKPFDQIGAIDKGVQILLAMKYRELLHNKMPLPSFDEVLFRAFSQTGEDGLLHYIFSLIGTTSKKCVEICAGDGIKCNTANLIVNHGWEGLLFDGKKRNVEIGRSFYKKCKDTTFWPPKFVHAWITTDSVNELIRRHGFTGQIDLLSLDIDGNDYWVWEAIDCIQPRAVILEYNNAWGPDRSVTQDYQPDFVVQYLEPPLPACGASLPAFVKLGRRKGYRLVGCNRLCFNAVFLRDGVGETIFPEVSALHCHEHPVAQYRIQYRAARERAKPLAGHWVEV